MIPSSKRAPVVDAPARTPWGRLFGRGRPSADSRKPRDAREARDPREPAPHLPPHVRMRNELQARLLVHDAASGLLVRNLYTVYKAMDGRGWSGIEALAPSVVNRALAEAEILQSHEPSATMGLLVDELRVLDEAARARAIEAERHRTGHSAVDGLPSVTGAPEVSEISEDEYALVERSWVGTIPDPDARRADTVRQDLPTMSLEFPPTEPMPAAA